jgi:hypothetical protein
VGQSKLDAALAWARRGFRLFPLVANSRRPAVKAFTLVATTDETRIAEWFGGDSDYNIGVDTTGMVVLDVDVKSGKQGLDTFTALGLTWDTLTVRTPSGGYHCYYDGPDSRLSVEKLGSGLDIRSHHGYVIGPGSVIDGLAYEVAVDAPVREVPDAVRRYLEPPRPKEADLVSNVEWDTPANVQACANYLQSAPPAIEGQGGNNRTYETAAYCRDFGVSPATILQLMMDHYSPRCSPQWTVWEMQQIVSNAWEYGTGASGKLSPSHVFYGATVPDPPAIEQARGAVFFGNIVPMEMIAPRPWLVSRMLMLRETTMLVAPGGAGKSSFTLALAAHVALGRDFAGSKAHMAGKVVVYNAEDDQDEMSRRLYAVCAEYALPFDQVKDRIALISRDQLNLKLTVNQRPASPNSAHITYLKSLCAEPEVVLLALDPLVALHTANEDDNAEMSMIMDLLMDVARETNVSLLVSHHTSKGSSATENAGSDTAARGAGSIITRCRIALTLYGASKQDCIDYHIKDDERHRFVRLDDAKMQYAARSGTATWFERVDHKLYNGDGVGVVRPISLAASAEAVVNDMARVLHGEMMAKATSEVGIKEAVEMLISGHPLYAKLPRAQVKGRIEAALQGGVVVADGARLVALHDVSKGSAPMVVRIE